MAEEKLPLHLKYRPRTLGEVFGNKPTLDSLRKVLAKGDAKPRSYLFSGPSGCGKTTLARILQRYLRCEDFYFYEMNAGNVRGIDTIRELEEMMRYAPNTGDSIIFFLDEAHMLTKEAQNALLKPLEEPPPYIYFMLASTDPKKLIKTIQTRCSHFQVSPLNRRDLGAYLKEVVDKEGKTVSPETIKKIVSNSSGLVRSALIMLDQVIDLKDETNQLKALHNVSPEDPQIIDLCKGLFRQASWSEVAPLILALDKEDPESVRRAILGYARSVLLKSRKQEFAAWIIECFAESFFASGKAGLAASCYNALHIK